MSAEARQNLDLIAAVVAGLVLAAAVVAIPVTAVKAVLAAPLCLLLPGYVATMAIFARVRLERQVQVMLVPALSLVLLVLGGMLLNEVPGGIRESSWAILLVVIIVGGAAVAWRLRVAESLANGRARHTVALRPSIKPGNALVLILAVLIAGGALAASRIHLGAANANGYESLTLAQADHGHRVKLQVTSVRQHRASYRIVVQVGSAVRVRRTVTMAPGAVYTVTLTVAPSRQAQLVSASAVLTPGHWTPRLANLQLPATS